MIEAIVVAARYAFTLRIAKHHAIDTSFYEFDIETEFYRKVDFLWVFLVEAWNDERVLDVFESVIT